ncbi:TRAP transporter large permease subunit [Chloroflexota bacterium]
MEWIGIGLLIALVLMGAPVWVAIIMGSSIIIAGHLDMSGIMIAQLMYAKVSQIALVAVPLFIWSGQLLAMGGGFQAVSQGT